MKHVFYLRSNICMLMRCNTTHGTMQYQRKRVLLKAGLRPGARGPRPATARRPGGPEARLPGDPEDRWPSPHFSQFFCPAVNPRACTYLHRVWACKMGDGEFEFVYHLKSRRCGRRRSCLCSLMVWPYQFYLHINELLQNRWHFLVVA